MNLNSKQIGRKTDHKNMLLEISEKAHALVPHGLRIHRLWMSHSS